MSMETCIKKGAHEFGRKSVKYGQKILKLIEVVWAPKQVAVMHCRGNQKEETTAVWGK
jgi:predicted nucleic-acid-binding Zn-ribbon protein